MFVSCNMLKKSRVGRQGWQVGNFLFFLLLFFLQFFLKRQATKPECMDCTSKCCSVLLFLNISYCFDTKLCCIKHEEAIPLIWQICPLPNPSWGIINILLSLCIKVAVSPFKVNLLIYIHVYVYRCLFMFQISLNGFQHKRINT